MKHIKVIATGHVIEIYEMEKEPVSPWDYADDWKNKKGKEIVSDKVLKDRKQERREQTLRDGRNKLRRLALANFDSEDCLVTLTYKENTGDVERADKDFKAFMRSFRRYTGQSIKYIAVREFQKRGAIHFHFLCDWKYPNLHKDNEEKIKQLEREVAEICWGNGFIDISPLGRSRSKRKEYKDKPVDNVGAYISKCMTKEKDDTRLRGHKLYLTSRGLIQPMEYRGLEAEVIIKAYELGNKKEIFTNSYDSEYLGQITYKEYNLKRL